VSRPNLAMIIVLLASTALFTLGTVNFANGAATPEPRAYALVDPNAGGTPTFVEQDNMAGVRRVAPGTYCLHANIRLQKKPIAFTTTDLTSAGGGQGLAFSESGSPLCAADEATVVTYRLLRGLLRPSNTIRFIVDPVA